MFLPPIGGGSAAKRVEDVAFRESAIAPRVTQDRETLKFVLHEPTGDNPPMKTTYQRLDLQMRANWQRKKVMLSLLDLFARIPQIAACAGLDLFYYIIETSS